jgi:hypothetical protein
VRRRVLPAGVAPRAALFLAALALMAGLVAGAASGERVQRGNLVLSLDGGLSPLRLPRDHPAPVAVTLAGGLQTADGTVLPRVTRIELGLPKQGILSTRGLPSCSRRQLRDTTSTEALAGCGQALVGHGRIDAEVLIPNQPPFRIHSRLLAFNGRVGGRTAVLLHAFASHPPSVVVLPFIVQRRAGHFGTALVADLSAALGPWPRFAHFEMVLSRRFSYRGHIHSYLSASCPTPRSQRTGYFSLARATYTLDGGRQVVSPSIVRACRAR